MKLTNEDSLDTYCSGDTEVTLSSNTKHGLGEFLILVVKI